MRFLKDRVSSKILSVPFDKGKENPYTWRFPDLTFVIGANSPCGFLPWFFPRCIRIPLLFENTELIWGFPKRGLCSGSTLLLNGKKYYLCLIGTAAYSSAQTLVLCDSGSRTPYPPNSPSVFPWRRVPWRTPPRKPQIHTSSHYPWTPPVLHDGDGDYENIGGSGSCRSDGANSCSNGFFPEPT